MVRRRSTLKCFSSPLAGDPLSANNIASPAHLLSPKFVFIYDIITCWPDSNSNLSRSCLLSGLPGGLFPFHIPTSKKPFTPTWSSRSDGKTITGLGYNSIGIGTGHDYYITPIWRFPSISHLSWRQPKISKITSAHACLGIRITSFPPYRNPKTPFLIFIVNF